MGGLVMIVGAAVVIGCPVRQILRLGSGDWAAVTALAGLAGGVWLGTLYLRAGFSLGLPRPARTLQALILPMGMVALLVAGIARAPFLIASEAGAGARHAPWFISVGIGALIGAAAQRSRFCVTGAFRNFILARERTLLWGLVAMLVATAATSLITGQFEPTGHGASAHSDHVWYLLGMALVGFGAMLVGGCPLRQLVLSAEGDVDGGLAVVGMICGAALCENVGLASSAFGTTHYGRIAVLLGFIFLLQLAMSSREV
jgi:YedE family putative selenium metabolism protein